MSAGGSARSEPAASTSCIAAPKPLSVWSEHAAPLTSLRDFCVAACSDQTDKGFGAAMQLVEAAGSLLAKPPADIDLVAAALYALPAKTNPTAPGGNKGNWDAAAGGKEELQLRYRAAIALVIVLRDEYAE